MKHHIALALVVLTTAQPLAAQDDDEALLRDALEQLAHVSGQLSACDSGLGPGREGVANVVGLIAEWKHPGRWAWLLGMHEEYLTEVTRQADIAFAGGQVEGCSAGILESQNEALAGQIVRDIENEVSR